MPWDTLFKISSKTKFPLVFINTELALQAHPCLNLLIDSKPRAHRDKSNSFKVLEPIPRTKNPSSSIAILDSLDSNTDNNASTPISYYIIYYIIYYTDANASMTLE